MDEERIEMLINSYGLSHLLVLCDLEPVKVLEFLIEQGLIDAEDLRELF